MTLHFSNIWETVADTVGDRIALIGDSGVRSWRDYEDRAARLAAAFDAAGIGLDSKVGIYLHNSNEYLEAQFATFKVGGCPINVNYRYKADELIYLLDNADAEALVFQSSYAARIQEVRKQLPKLKLLVQVDDHTETLLPDVLDYERIQRDHRPRPRTEPIAGGVYMLYTGGTTGMPKGVMYDLANFAQSMVGMATGGRGFVPPTTVEDLAALLPQVTAPPVSLPASPLMHGTGMWLGAMVPHAIGGTVVTTSKLGLDPHQLWSLVEEHGVTDMVIVGDAFANPLLTALREASAQGRPYRLESLAQIISSGVMWSAEVKQALLEHLDTSLIDIIGSSEGGMGMSVTTREAAAPTAKFELSEGVRVFTDDDEEVEPGSGVMGKVGTSGSVPLGYYKDPQKSAATFREINGVRYSFPGDYATVAADGSITLLGRGSACINTAGEKVFPEEVEEALKRHDAVRDALVVGLKDPRFGERVVGVVANTGPLTDAALIDFAREQLAGYKVPKQILFVAEVRRAPNGKADYKWARAEAERELSAASQS
ncbi:MAG: AMP-binding protein [Pseudomonadota bacterium]